MKPKQSLISVDFKTELFKMKCTKHFQWHGCKSYIFQFILIDNKKVRVNQNKSLKLVAQQHSNIERKECISI